MASHLKNTCQIVAPDLRGHGLTLSKNDLDLSADTLAADVAALWNELYSTSQSSLPPTLIVGHSMGGAIAVHTASLCIPTSPAIHTKSVLENSTTPTNVSRYIPTLEGIIVIDVVEGTAMSSLPFMKTVLQKRPGSFPNSSAAVEWALETGFSRNAEAASISVPAMLKIRGTSTSTGTGNAHDGDFAAIAASVAAANAAWNTTGKTRTTCVSAASELEPICEQQGQEQSMTPPLGRPPRPLGQSTDTDTASPKFSPSPSSSSYLKTSFGTTGAWVWRTPLEESSSYWEGWYRNLSSLYLNLKIPKMLILAGTDRLDRELTIGQMQGKFQLVLLSRAGHAVHEDEAGEVSAAVKGFIHRFKIGQTDKSLGVPGLVSENGSLFRVPENDSHATVKGEEQNHGGGPGVSRFRPATAEAEAPRTDQPFFTTAQV
jgi:protein phosphatase methylesterase 1